MAKHRHVCSDERLLAILAERENNGELEQTLTEVEQCRQCQQRLEELAADGHVWQRTQEILSGFDSSARAFRSKPDRYPFGTNVEAEFAQRQSRWAESMASQLLSPASHPEMLGRIGRYEVERLIGSGGMGVVFKAIDTELNRHVAIKVLAPFLAGNGAARQRFSREAKAAAAVVHEHVVPIYNVESDGESPFLVMPYVAGESLQARIDREGPLELCEILRIGMQVADGLEAAHLQGLIHRDIKPSNIMLEQGVERSLITDFGLARTTDDASLTNTGHYAGTPQYMSPEQARGDAIDFRSDLFSLGSVIYAMCAGRPPFRAETAYGVLRKITDSQPRSLQEVNPRIPPWLEHIVDKLIAKQPADRFQSAAELAALLKECLAHVQRPTTNQLPHSLAKATDAQKRARRKRSLAWFASVPLVAILAWFSSGPVYSLTLWLTNTLSQQTVKPPDTGRIEPTAKEPDKPRRVAQRLRLPPDPADDVRAKLSQSVEIDTEEMTLPEIASQIAKAIGTSVELNRPSLAEENVDLTQPLKVAGKTSVRSLLRRVGDAMSVAYIVHDGGLEIVPRSYAQTHPVLRYYELAYIMPDSQGLGNLVSMIEQTIAPDQWKINGGESTIAIIESVLVIRTTESIHSQIEQLLSQIPRRS